MEGGAKPSAMQVAGRVALPAAAQVSHTGCAAAGATAGQASMAFKGSKACSLRHSIGTAGLPPQPRHCFGSVVKPLSWRAAPTPACRRTAAWASQARACTAVREGREAGMHVARTTAATVWPCSSRGHHLAVGAAVREHDNFPNATLAANMGCGPLATAPPHELGPLPQAPPTSSGP